MEQFLQRLERAIWGWPLLLLLLGAGLVVSLLLAPLTAAAAIRIASS